MQSKEEINGNSLEKIFEVNKYITLKLIKGKTVLFVENEEFKQCRHLLLNFFKDEIENYEDIKSIDEASEKIKKMEEGIGIDPETEFWGHCSNLQAWVENDYNTELLHRNLAFPLLKILSEKGDKLAKQKFKEEIARRYKEGSYSVQAYLFEEGFLSYLTKEELLNGILSSNDAIFMERVMQSAENYSLIPCFDLIRDIDREDKFFFSIENGKIKEVEVVINEFLLFIPSEIENLEEIYRLDIVIIEDSQNIFEEKFLSHSKLDLRIFCIDDKANVFLPDLFYYFSNLEKLEIRGFNCHPTVELEESLLKIRGLKYLSLSNVNLNLLPDSIRNQKKLEVLELRGLPVKNLPVLLILRLNSLAVLKLEFNLNLKILEVDKNKLKKKLRRFTYLDKSDWTINEKHWLSE
jgi:hypothetical protein